MTEQENGVEHCLGCGKEVAGGVMVCLDCIKDIAPDLAQGMRESTIFFLKAKNASQDTDAGSAKIPFQE